MSGNKKKEILLRAYLGFLLVCLLGAAILGRAFYIQTVEGEHYRSLADSLTIFPKKITAERGNIFSEDGRLLATTLPMFDLRIDFKTTSKHPKLFNKHVDSVAMLLSRMFPEKSKETYKTELVRGRNQKKRYHLLRRNVTFEQLSEIRTWPLFREGAYKSGIVTVQKDKRFRPFGLLAQRSIGFTNGDGAKVGLEGNCDELLRGTQGQMMVQKISGGTTIPLDSRDEISPQPGRDVYTTINVELQDVAEDALNRALDHHRADHGCVVLMEVKTGRIKAIANLGLNRDSVYDEIQNYAVGEITAPGSTFKLATVAALMEDGLITNETKVDVGTGQAKFYDRTIKDHDAPETPEMTVKRAIEVSSNVAVAKLAYQSYASTTEKFYDHLVDFGFTKPIGIELPGAAKPVLADPKKWSGVSTAYIAHGYEVLITPMHTLTFYNAIANNGVMVQPHLVEKIKEYSVTVDSFETVVLNEKLLSDRTIEQLQEILRGVVENGTATNLKTPYLHVAGKTGTAVIAQGNKGYRGGGNKIYQASFCGYFPAENPEYSMIVVINSPSTNGYYGNVVAGAIFKEVADKVFSLNLHMHEAVNKKMIAENNIPVIQKADAEDMKSIYNFFGAKVDAMNSEWARAEMVGNKVSLSEHDFMPGVVPDVRGMSPKDAIYLLESMGMKVNIAGAGNVKNQSVLPNSRINKGTLITLTLG